MPVVRLAQSVYVQLPVMDKGKPVSDSTGKPAMHRVFVEEGKRVDLPAATVAEYRKRGLIDKSYNHQEHEAKAKKAKEEEEAALIEARETGAKAALATAVPPSADTSEDGEGENNPSE